MEQEKAINLRKTNFKSQTKGNNESNPIFTFMQTKSYESTFRVRDDIMKTNAGRETTVLRHGQSCTLKTT